MGQTDRDGRNREQFLAKGEACMALLSPTPALKERIFDGSEFSADGSLISASCIAVSKLAVTTSILKVWLQRYRPRLTSMRVKTWADQNHGRSACGLPNCKLNIVWESGNCAHFFLSSISSTGDCM